jgi:uncharacterized protein YkwD
MLVSFLVSLAWATSACAQAEETNAPFQTSLAPINCTASSAVLTSVTAGPLQPERFALLTKIQEAKNRGVGIQTYMTALLDLENMVKQGATQESIQSRLNSIESALVGQLSQQDTIKRLVTPMRQKISKNLMSLKKARLYVLALVNADRARYNLSPVSLDSIASVAGQIHTDEMAAVGYGAHWDLSGKKPSQRYTEAGGIHNDSENIEYSYGNCLSNDHLFAAEELVEMQSSFMSEKAPHDGHRLQILRPEHNKLGVGLSCSANPNGEAFLCLAQEFIDQYGEYSKLPIAIVRSKFFDVSGSLLPGFTLDRVSIDWDPAPKPMTKEELSKTYSYANGDCSITEFYAELEPKIVKVWKKGGRQHFTVRIVPDESWKSGLYYVSISAKSSKFNRSIQVSIRTTHLD